MCFHSEQEITRWHSDLSDVLKKQYGYIIMRYTSPEERMGKFAEAFPVDVRKSQDIANTIRDLRTWHPNGKRVIDLSDINTRRDALGLPFLDANGLPLPDRPARAAMTDEEIDAEFKRQDMSRKVGVLLSTSDSTRKAIGKAADDGLAKKIADRNRENAELAASLGVTPEELIAAQRPEIEQKV